MGVWCNMRYNRRCILCGQFAMRSQLEISPIGICPFCYVHTNAPDHIPDEQYNRYVEGLVKKKEEV